MLYLPAMSVFVWVRINNLLGKDTLSNMFQNIIMTMIMMIMCRHSLTINRHIVENIYCDQDLI